MQAVFNDFRLKIYNKSWQYGMNTNTIRIEVDFSRMKSLNDLGIKTLVDLPENLHKGLELVLNKFDGITYYDETIIKTKLTKPQKKNLPNYRNNNYWLVDLKPNKRFGPKRKLSEIISNNSQNLKEKIRLQFLKSRVINTQLFKNRNRVINTHSSIEVFVIQKRNKVCLVTGEDISMQKDLSHLLSNKGLKHLKKKKSN